LLGVTAIFLAGLILGIEIGHYHRSVEAFAEAAWARWEAE
jgi:hypothetical protein